MLVLRRPGSGLTWPGSGLTGGMERSASLALLFSEAARAPSTCASSSSLSLSRGCSLACAALRLACASCTSARRRSASGVSSCCCCCGADGLLLATSFTKMTSSSLSDCWPRRSPTGCRPCSPSSCCPPRCEPSPPCCICPPSWPAAPAAPAAAADELLRERRLLRPGVLAGPESCPLPSATSPIRQQAGGRRHQPCECAACQED